MLSASEQYKRLLFLLTHFINSPKLLKRRIEGAKHLEYLKHEQDNIKMSHSHVVSDWIIANRACPR